MFGVFCATLALATLVLATVAQAHETTKSKSPKRQPQQAASDTTKQAPPLLHPKHRRGIYWNAKGISVVDATPQSPPLETDDPGVPDKREYEINITTRADFSKDLRTLDLLFVDANYGLLPTIFGHELPTQLKVEFPLAGVKTSSEPMVVGIGAARVGLKFLFYSDERRGAYASLYPQMEFGVPGTNGVDRGLVEPGQTFILPLLVQKELEYFTLVANGVLDQPIHDPERRTTGTLGIGLGRALAPQIAIMVEGRYTSTFDLDSERLLVVNLGLMRRLQDNLGIYAKVGRSLYSDEGSGHTYVGFGLKTESSLPPPDAPASP